MCDQLLAIYKSARKNVNLYKTRFRFSSLRKMLNLYIQYYLKYVKRKYLTCNINIFFVIPKILKIDHLLEGLKIENFFYFSFSNLEPSLKQTRNDVHTHTKKKL